MFYTDEHGNLYLLQSIIKQIGRHGVSINGRDYMHLNSEAEVDHVMGHFIYLLKADRQKVIMYEQIIEDLRIFRQGD